MVSHCGFDWDSPGDERCGTSFHESVHLLVVMFEKFVLMSSSLSLIELFVFWVLSLMISL